MTQTEWPIFSCLKQVCIKNIFLYAAQLHFTCLFIWNTVDAKYREKLVCCPNQAFPPLQNNEITQQQPTPGGSFQQLPIGFPFQQVTMRPPWAVKPSTAQTTTTTTTPAPTKAPSTKKPSWGWQPPSQKPTWGGQWPGTQTTKTPTWGQWPSAQQTTKKPTWGQWPHGTTKKPTWGQWPQQQMTTTTARPTIGQWPPPLPTHAPFPTHAPLPTHAPFNPAIGQWPPPLPTSATHKPPSQAAAQPTPPQSMAPPAPVSSSCGRVRVVNILVFQINYFVMESL